MQLAHPFVRPALGGPGVRPHLWAGDRTHAPYCGLAAPSMPCRALAVHGPMHRNPASVLHGCAGLRHARPGGDGGPPLPHGRPAGSLYLCDMPALLSLEAVSSPAKALRTGASPPCFCLLIAYLQRRAGLSTAAQSGVHFIVDWLGWLCYLQSFSILLWFLNSCVFTDFLDKCFGFIFFQNLSIGHYFAVYHKGKGSHNTIGSNLRKVCHMVNRCIHIQFFQSGAGCFFQRMAFCAPRT